MPHVPRLHPPALPHGELREVLPGLYFVTGTVRMPGPLPVRFSRNMTVVRSGERLVVVNSVRLDDAGLAALDKLGKVTDVVRLAANHGMDDPFYAERYGAKVWVVKGQRYTAGFATSKPETYFTPDHEMDASTALPIANAKLFVMDAQPPEGLLVLADHGGIVISGDCLQHWAQPDEYFNWLARIAMRAMGFIKPYNIGPAWLKQCKPPKEQLCAILDLSFANVLPSHGAAVLGDARERYRAAIERVT
ncbi:MAG TPA: hypothetical protein VMJ10_06350 [Kofleriaceae bacterium]|nr:hypothetical protein [Kofleriaceae bacterium]